MLDKATLDIAQFYRAFNDRFILATAFTEDDLADLLVPFRWYESDDVFPQFHDVLRSAMARLLALVSIDTGAATFVTKSWAEAATLIEGIVQRGVLQSPARSDPLKILMHASQDAMRIERPASVLDEVEEMDRFHAGWRGVVPDAVLDLSDADVYAAITDSCQMLLQAKTTVYNLVRGNGNEHLDLITSVIHDLLPVDQCSILLAMDAFSSDANVVVFFDTYLETTQSDHCRQEAVRIREQIVR